MRVYYIGEKLEIDEQDKKISTYIEKQKSISLIYLLVKNEDVVYVGQTTKGYERPNAHKDKDFDGFYVIYCNEKDLDKIEDKYIKKYRPKYNKILNRKSNCGIYRVAKYVRTNANCNSINYYDIIKIIKLLKIETYYDLRGELMISSKDAENIMKFVKGGQYAKRPTRF